MGMDHLMEKSGSRLAISPWNDLTDTSALQDEAAERALRGTKCMHCGQLMLGERVACSGCMSSEVSGTALARGGEVYSWSEVHVMAGREGPVTLAYVDLADGVRVLAELRLDRAPRIGERLSLVANEDGAWWFGPQSVVSEAGR